MPKSEKKLDPLLAGMPERLTQTRIELGLGVRELGELSGVGVACVSRIENKKRLAGLAVSSVIPLARALGVHVQWLLTGEGAKKADGRYMVIEMTPAVIEMLRNSTANIEAATGARRK